jgi:dipeptidyl aminopeptidase/acylaminoacyl peptidase
VEGQAPTARKNISGPGPAKMNARRLSLLVLICLVCTPWLVGIQAAAAQGGSKASAERSAAKSAVTVADAIEMTQIGYQPAHDDYRSHDNVVEFSPDRSKFVFVTSRGNLKNNTVEFSLLVFRTADAFGSPAPEVVATLASSSNRDAITKINWLPDNDTIVFLGEQPGENPQVYKVSCRTRQLVKLTNQPTLIADYAVSRAGDRIIYLAPPELGPVLSEEKLQRGFAITSEHWVELYENRYSKFDTRKEIFVVTPGTTSARQVGGVLDLETYGYSELSISPNGRYALLDGWVNEPPKIWGEYKAALLASPVTTPCVAGKAQDCPEQHLIVDLEEGTVGPLIGAPILPIGSGGEELRAWTNRNSVLLINTLLPLDIADPEGRKRRGEHLYAAEVTLPEREIVEIAERDSPFPVDVIEPDSTPDRIVARPREVTVGPPLEFRLDSSGWKIRQLDQPPKPTEGLAVTLEQDLNSPPKLVATEPGTRRKSVLLDLNPQFAKLTFGRVEVFKWKAKDGHAMAGTLYYPPDYAAGVRYPLVIQTHGYSHERFWVDGPYSTGFAAQPLANKSIVVLQVDMGDTDVKDWSKDAYSVLDTAKEGPHEVASYEAAVDELDRKGLIDRNRVGLTGFSRMAYHVLYTLTHSKYHFAAAIVSDGVNFGYGQCVFVSAIGDDMLKLCERMNGGGPPYGDSLSGWGKAAPTFNLDKIEAPVLLQAIGNPFSEWEIFAGLKWLNKPVELLNFFPSGEHVLVKPWQRMLSQQTTVDWYCFWLKGEEDPNPAKAEQYSRWRAMRSTEKPAGKASQTN